MNDKLVAFLYLLMRDELPTGVLERIMRDIEDAPKPLFSAAYLENYARQFAERLTR